MVPIDNSKLAEMEFYLMEDLECDRPRPKFK